MLGLYASNYSGPDFQNDDSDKKRLETERISNLIEVTSTLSNIFNDTSNSNIIEIDELNTAQTPFNSVLIGNYSGSNFDQNYSVNQADNLERYFPRIVATSSNNESNPEEIIFDWFTDTETNFDFFSISNSEDSNFEEAKRSFSDDPGKNETKNDSELEDSLNEIAENSGTLTKLHSLESKNTYKIGEKIGQGSFGVVYEATKEGTDEKYAAKVMPMEKWKNATEQSSVFCRSAHCQVPWVIHCNEQRGSVLRHYYGPVWKWQLSQFAKQKSNEIQNSKENFIWHCTGSPIHPQSGNGA